MNYFKYLIQGILVLAGLLCFRSAFFLYENQEGEIQNKLEQWWIHVDDYRDVLLSRHSAFMRRVARLTKAVLDKIFGTRILSLRAAWPLAFFAYASVLIVGSIAFIFDSKLIGIILSLCAVLPLLLGLLPMWIGREGWIKWGCLGIIMLYVASILLICIVGSTISNVKASDILKSYLGSTIGLLLINVTYSLLIQLLRWSVRKCAEFTSFLKIVATIIILLLISVLLVVIPFSILVVLVINRTFPRILVSALIGLMMGNLAGAVPIFLFMLLSILIVCHQILWEFVDKPLYAAQRFQIVRNRKLLVSTGVLLITAAGIPLLSKIVNFIINASSGR
jgi:hypothetical protein